MEIIDNIQENQEPFEEVKYSDSLNNELKIDKYECQL